MCIQNGLYDSLLDYYFPTNSSHSYLISGIHVLIEIITSETNPVWHDYLYVFLIDIIIGFVLMSHQLLPHFFKIYKKVAMAIESLDERKNKRSEREWQKCLVKIIRDHGDIDEPIDRMLRIFRPILLLYMETIFIAGLHVALHRVSV